MQNEEWASSFVIALAAFYVGQCVRCWIEDKVDQWKQWRWHRELSRSLQNRHKQEEDERRMHDLLAGIR